MLWYPRRVPAHLLLTGEVPQCWHAGCAHLGSFGQTGKGKERYCSAHRRPGDVNLRKKRCCALGCLRSPSFGDPAAVAASAKSGTCVGARRNYITEITPSTSPHRNPPPPNPSPHHAHAHSWGLLQLLRLRRLWGAMRCCVSGWQSAHTHCRHYTQACILQPA
jgi:hypothetical protein